MTLEEAVTELVRLGHADPLDIADKVIDRNSRKWLSEQMLAYAHDFITDMARYRVNSDRRSAERALTRTAATSTRMKMAKVWIPEVGRKSVGDVTREELVARRAYYAGQVYAYNLRVAWCDDVLELMDHEGVDVVGAIEAPLPPLASRVEAPELVEIAA